MKVENLTDRLGNTINIKGDRLKEGGGEVDKLEQQIEQQKNQGRK